MDKVEKCPYCGLTYPHQGPTGCLTMTKAGGDLWTNSDPYLIWPRYTGRDKGPRHDERGQVYVFFSAGRAWAWIIEKYGFHNYNVLDSIRVLRVSEYMEAVRRG
jgi:hypothetical protein